MSAYPSEAFQLPALARLEALLELEILRLRARYELSLDEQRGLYISDDQVDRLLHMAANSSSNQRGAILLAAADRLWRESAAALSESPRWSHVVAEFSLTPFELDALILAVAPELDRKYQTIYAYLNDDVAKKWATRDLALRLFASEWPPDAARASLSAEGILLSSGLLQVTGDSHYWLTGGFVSAEPVTHFLSGVAALGGRRSPAFVTGWPALDWFGIGVAGDACDAMCRVPLLDGAPIVIMEGRDGSGRRRAAAALATQLDSPLVTIDVRLVRPNGESLSELVRVALLQQRLHRAVVHIDGGANLAERDNAQSSDVRSAIASLGAARGSVLVSVAPGTRWRDLFGAIRCVSIDFGEPAREDRLRLWQDLRGESADARDDKLGAIADRFAFTRGQIERASAAADDQWTLSGRNGTGPDEDLLFEAARVESRSGLGALGALASRTTTTAQWKDLILPPTTMQLLRELADAIRNRSTVYDDWGMASRNSGARGIRALMSGASGTGKSTCAAIIASAELGVDLYTVDLSAVSSKYIGDTEKNLDKIFSAARNSSAILFFDEADALFGKRSEVKDAHDRYSNIEVAYLLQKIDLHDGTILLASNLANNLDQGFSRRMHYTIEFPFPGEADRERIWRGMFPPAAPIADDVDYGFLARQFRIAGGDIRNVALSAAFLAAAAGRAISMRDLVRAMARQMMKQGRSPSIADFREYLPLLQDD